MVDACSIPHWDCPDFFKLAGDNLCGVIELDNLKQRKVRVEFIGTTSSSLKSIINQSKHLE